MAIDKRHPDSFPEVTSLLDDDNLIIQEDNVIKHLPVSHYKSILQADNGESDVPVTYNAKDSIGNFSVRTRKGAFEVVNSLILAYYGSEGSDNKLKLSVINENSYFKEGTFYSLEGTVYVTYDDATTDTFDSTDNTLLDMRIISPWGVVPSTEEFTDLRNLPVRTKVYYNGSDTRNDTTLGVLLDNIGTEDISDVTLADDQIQYNGIDEHSEFEVVLKKDWGFSLNIDALSTSGNNTFFALKNFHGITLKGTMDDVSVYADVDNPVDSAVLDNAGAIIPVGEGTVSGVPTDVSEDMIDESGIVSLKMDGLTATNIVDGADIPDLGTVTFASVLNHKYYDVLHGMILTGTSSDIAVTNNTGATADIAVIYLTSVFGSGNEPSEANCAKIFSYFDGTKSIQMPARIISKSEDESESSTLYIADDKEAMSIQDIKDTVSVINGEIHFTKKVSTPEAVASGVAVDTTNYPTAKTGGKFAVELTAGGIQIGIIGTDSTSGDGTLRYELSSPITTSLTTLITTTNPDTGLKEFTDELLAYKNGTIFLENAFTVEVTSSDTTLDWTSEGYVAQNSDLLILDSNNNIVNGEITLASNGLSCTVEGITDDTTYTVHGIDSNGINMFGNTSIEYALNADTLENLGTFSISAGDVISGVYKEGNLSIYKNEVEQTINQPSQEIDFSLGNPPDVNGYIGGDGTEFNALKTRNILVAEDMDITDISEIVTLFE